MLTPRRVTIGLVVLAGAAVAAVFFGGRGRIATAHEKYAAMAERAIPVIERSTGRKFLTAPVIEERTRDQVRAFLEKAFEDQTPQAELAGTEAAYKRFGFFPDEYSLRTQLLELLAEQVIGYYDPKTDVLYVVQDAPEEYVSTTVAHELVHALQDQHFPLDSLERIRASNDRRLAAQAVAEGQAVWEQLVVLTGFPNPANAMPGGWDRVRQTIREDHTGMPQLATAPTLLREELLFPYLSGAEHIRQLKASAPGRWPFDSLPESTEQILHADKYLGERDRPTTVTLPPLQTGTRIWDGDLGEFETRIYFYEHSQDLNLAARAAGGWDGDRYELVRLPSGGDALVWATVWDTPLDAAEFVDALDTALPMRYAGMARRETSSELRRFSGGGRTVDVRFVTIDGRSVVLLTDVPAGASANLVAPTAIKLTP